MEGWIKIKRSLSYKGWSKKPDYVALWVHLLLMANHADSEYFWNGKTITLKAGQLITGRKNLASVSGISESKVERILKCFESEQQIEQLKTSTSRLISIRNWMKHQQSEQRSEQRVNNEWTTSEQRVDTKEEEKELKKKKKKKNSVGGFTPPTTQEVYDYFIEIEVNGNETNKFWDYYQSKGWMVGKTKMKDWKAACRNWKKNIPTFNLQNNGKQPKSARTEMDKLRDWYATVNAPSTGSTGE